jgi:predicted RecA/RadA family phage recombinase
VAVLYDGEDGRPNDMSFFGPFPVSPVDGPLWFVETDEPEDDSIPADTLAVYAQDRNGFTTLRAKDDTNLVMQFLRDNFERVRADNDVDKGEAVYVTGSTGFVATVDLADASDPVKEAIGIAVEDIGSGNFGRIITLGVLRRVKTNYAGWAEGDLIYLDATTPGALTKTPPPHPNMRQPVATVRAVHSSQGRLSVRIGTSDGNFLGTRQNDYKIGDGTDGDKLLTFAGLTARALTMATATGLLSLPGGLDVSAGTIGVGSALVGFGGGTFTGLYRAFTTTTETAFQAVTSAASVGFQASRFGGSALMQLRRANGAPGSATAILSNDQLGTIQFLGWTGSATQQGAQVVGTARENFGAAWGTSLNFVTVAVGGTSLVGRWQLDEEAFWPATTAAGNANNLYDIGKDASRPRTVYAGTGFIGGSFDGTTGAFSGVVSLPDGAHTAPALTFTSDPDTGLFSAGADVLGLAAGGELSLRIYASTTTMYSTYRATFGDGAEDAPGYAFASGGGDGMWRDGTDVSFSRGGVTQLTLGSLLATFAGAGAFSGQITSTLADGTAPFVITSTTVSANLNADLVDGQHASAFAAASHTHVKADITDFAHTHVKADITDFAHGHNASEITAGTFPSGGHIFAGELTTQAGSLHTGTVASRWENALTTRPSGSGTNHGVEIGVVSSVPTVRGYDNLAEALGGLKLDALTIYVPSGNVEFGGAVRYIYQSSVAGPSYPYGVVIAGGTTNLDKGAYVAVYGADHASGWSAHIKVSSPDDAAYGGLFRVIHGSGVDILSTTAGDITKLNCGWDFNVASGKVYRVNGTQVVAAQGAAVADATGGTVIDAEARTAINTLLARVRVHGLIAT